MARTGHKVCLLCGATDGVEDAHFPYDVGMGRKRARVSLPTVPLCVYCHRLEHLNDHETVDALIRSAPEYWQRCGVWDSARPHLERYLARREYLEGTCD